MSDLCISKDQALRSVALYGKKKKKGFENCCICGDRELSQKNWLTCGHVVCPDCLRLLVVNQCPVCRERLSGKIVTEEILQIIQDREKEFDQLLEQKDHITATYLSHHPHIDRELLYSIIQLLDEPILLLEIPPYQLEGVYSALRTKLFPLKT